MADKPASKTKRRVVKNPETFRERALKATDENDKPKRGAGIKKASGTAVKPILGPSRKLFGLKPFRIIGKILVPVYFRNSWKELRLVTWPSWDESRRLTYAVLVFAIIFGLSIAGVDYVLDRIFRDILIN